MHDLWSHVHLYVELCNFCLHIINNLYTIMSWDLYLGDKTLYFINS